MGYGLSVPLLHIIIGLIIVGVVLYLINTYIPMAASIKSLLNLVVVIAVVIWLLKEFGLWGSITSYHFGG